MKAVRLQTRGGAEQLRYEDVPDPTPGSDDALVRVHATGITPTELSWRETWESNGEPRLRPIPGHELSGVVVSAPKDAPVHVGEAVFGLTAWDRDGTLAELTAIRASDLAAKPESLDHVQTAALPLSALTAWQAFDRHAHVDADSTVLIHGAAGGVGAYAVQFAHDRGAHVIGTASGRHTAFLHDLGCDQVIDYTTTDFARVVKDVDVVLDTVGGEALERSFDVLRPGGWLVTIAEPLAPSQVSARQVHATYFLVEPDRGDLTSIAALATAERLRPIVSRVLPLHDAQTAYQQGLAGHNRGKTVLTVP